VAESHPPRGRPPRRRVILVALALAVPATATAVSMLPAEAAGAPVAGATYQLSVTKSGKCIDVVNGSTANGGLLQQWSCTNARWQQFTVVSGGSGVYNLVNVNSGKCVDVPSGSTQSGIQLNQWTCGNSTNQQWRFVASGSGTYQIVSVRSGLCVSDQGASTSSGAAVIQETCSANSNKQWTFNPVSADTCPCTVASDGSGTYRTVQAAVDAVPANKPYLTLQGAGSSPSDVVIVYNHSANSSGTSNSASVFVNGHDFVAKNLTIANDFDENSVTSGQQAVALNLGADRAQFSNVRLLGDQDTFLVNDSARAYVVNSYVEGTTDFIFGGGTIVFNNCTIYEKRSTGSVYTAASTAATKMYGFLFYKSHITGAAAAGTTNLGRPWRQDAQVLYRESTLDALVKTAQPWTDMSTNTWPNARFSEYRNTGAGATVNSNRPQLTDAQAGSYTPAKYLAGSDGWNPL
jgi:pectinesterase